MTSLLTGLLRGAAAGAAGTTALDAVSSADMAVRARPASDTPVETVSALADQAGVRLPGSRRDRSRRLDALSGLVGTATGVVVGGVAGALRASGVRLPTTLGGPLLGAAALAAGDGAATLSGVTDPRRWSGTDWVVDVLPHLAYGVTTHTTLVATFRADERERAEHPAGASRPATTGAVLRAAALGAATGSRSTTGLAALAWRSRRDDAGFAGPSSSPWARGVGLAAVAGELSADKHPAVPDRAGSQGLPPRLLFAASAGEVAATRDGVEPGPLVLTATAAALATAVGGKALRTAAHRRLGSDLPGALVEDALAVVLAGLGAGRA